MATLRRWLLLGLVVGFSGCAASTPPAHSVDDEEYGADDGVEEETSDSTTEDSLGSASEEDVAPPVEEAVQDVPAPEPEFTDGMSVNDAINAVPPGVPRVNVETESLSAPLMDFSVYEPCKLAPSQHFSIKVAVWEGRAVGIDVKTTPKNPTAEACLKERVQGLAWADSVKSLNTVEYGF